MLPAAEALTVEVGDLQGGINRDLIEHRRRNPGARLPVFDAVLYLAIPLSASPDILGHKHLLPGKQLLIPAVGRPYPDPGSGAGRGFRQEAVPRVDAEPKPHRGLLERAGATMQRRMNLLDLG